MRSSRLSRALVSVAVVATTLLLRASAAVAQSYPGGGQPTPTVQGTQFFRGGPNPADTGTNILLFILLALLALVLGLLLHTLSRRRADGREA